MKLQSQCLGIGAARSGNGAPDFKIGRRSVEKDFGNNGSRGTAGIGDIGEASSSPVEALQMPGRGLILESVDLRMGPSPGPAGGATSTEPSP